MNNLTKNLIGFSFEVGRYALIPVRKFCAFLISIAAIIVTIGCLGALGVAFYFLPPHLQTVSDALVGNQWITLLSCFFLMCFLVIPIGFCLKWLTGRFKWSWRPSESIALATSTWVLSAIGLGILVLNTRMDFSHSAELTERISIENLDQLKVYTHQESGPESKMVMFGNVRLVEKVICAHNVKFKVEYTTDSMAILQIKKRVFGPSKSAAKLLAKSTRYNFWKNSEQLILPLNTFYNAAIPWRNQQIEVALIVPSHLKDQVQVKEFSTKRMDFAS